jgi:hypothetical protein
MYFLQSLADSLLNPSLSSPSPLPLSPRSILSILHCLFFSHSLPPYAFLPPGSFSIQVDRLLAARLSRALDLSKKKEKMSQVYTAKLGEESKKLVKHGALLTAKETVGIPGTIEKIYNDIFNPPEAEETTVKKFKRPTVEARQIGAAAKQVMIPRPCTHRAHRVLSWLSPVSARRSPLQGRMLRTEPSLKCKQRGVPQQWPNSPPTWSTNSLDTRGKMTMPCKLRLQRRRCLRI